ncbi:MAG: transglycosylase domain-containing protein, partial [Actinomycetota bacterium]|nr:transglycosylase domain-containing protein [Actinomycetota bacterium]
MAGRASRRATPQRTPFLNRTLRLALKIIGVVVLTVLIVPPVAAAVGVSTVLFVDLPGNLPEEKPQIEARPSTVYDADGNEIGVFRQFDLTVPTQPADIPAVLKDAVVASEDQRFWDHNGVDLEGIARAARVNYEVGEVVQGGSTITQQYIKNVYLSGEQTYSRKLREAILATQLERRMSKEEILFRYLDTSYFGAGAYGVGAAAEVYFGKPVAQLTLSEAALLAGIIPAPTAYSPRTSPEVAESRRLLVLESMLEQELITPSQYLAAKPEVVWPASQGQPGGPATVIASPRPNGASRYQHFVDWVEQSLLDELGTDVLYRGGLRIETTIRPALQAEAEAAAAARLAGTEAPLEMSIVSLDPTTGHVVSMVGGRDYAASQVNLATGGSTGFQPGSSFKAIVLAEAFEQGIGPETIYPAPGSYTVPGCTGNHCTLSNYAGGGYGSLDLRRATERSVNTVYVQLALDVGLKATAEMANRLGIERIDPEGEYGASLALGAAEVAPLEMANAYGTFANHGVRMTPTGILRVYDAEGSIIVDNTRPTGERVLDAAVADNVTDVLTGIPARGTGTRAQIGRPVAGKTGTAQEYRAAWFVGYTPQYATAVWMGYSDAQRSLRWINGVGAVTGGSHPALAFSQYMSAAHRDLPVMEFAEPGPLPSRTGRAPGTGGAAITSGGGEGDEGADIVAAEQRAPSVLGADCGGACVLIGAPPTPDLDVPTTTTTAPPEDDAEDDDAG